MLQCMKNKSNEAKGFFRSGWEPVKKRVNKKTILANL